MHHASAALAPGRISVPNEREVARAPRLVWTIGSRELCRSAAGILTSGHIVRCLSHCTDNAVRDPDWQTYTERNLYPEKGSDYLV